ncbi:DNA primase [Francisella sp. TX07-6608]|uniref:DNA primase n=1 Tax=Francisella sp. TX07-6608 TaxID=573568 RepID=UPI0008F9DFC0|nr:DNA primase [Francisella sp. TX07-6608]OIN83058.1 toprim domain protein [Francisella sp. TX07-6608]
MNITKFNDFVSDIGYSLPNSFNYSIGLNELVRFKDTNKNKDNKDLWIKNIDNNIFVFGDWKTGEKYTYIDNDNQYNYHDKKETSYKLQQQKKAELQSKQELAKKLESYYISLPIADDNHPYLVAKGIKSHEAIKQDKDKLIIPCIGIDEPFKGKLQSIQTILPNGFKQFYKGANASSSYLPLNNPKDIDCFVFVEGLATGLSILNKLNSIPKKGSVFSKDVNNDICIIVCFNCNGLKPIVCYFYGLYPESEFYIFADNDLNGVGIQKAKEVAAIIPNVYINLPPLTDEQKQNGLSDWNDYLESRRVI